jgi:hypothetical protein
MADAARTLADMASAAMMELEELIEKWLRDMAPFAGRVDCLHCGGAGVIVKRTQSWRGGKCTLHAHIRRCNCVDIVGELRRRMKELS